MQRGRYIHLAALAGVLALAAGAAEPAHGAAITTPAGLQALPGPGQVLLTFRSNGEDLWDAVDSGAFLAMPVTGDYSVQCEVLEKPVAEGSYSGDNNVKIGPQIRDDLTVGSRYAYLHTTSGRGVLWERREAFLGNNGPPGARTGTEGTAGTDDATTTYPHRPSLT